MWAVVNKQEQLMCRDFRTKNEAINYVKSFVKVPVDIVNQISTKFIRIENKNKRYYQ